MTTARPAISTYIVDGQMAPPRQNAEPQVALPSGGGRQQSYSSSTMPHPRRAAAASTFNGRGHHKLQHSQSQRYSVNYQEEMRRQAYIQSLGEANSQNFPIQR